MSNTPYQEVDDFMSSKPFISARIPEELLKSLESRVDSTGKSKTDIITDALYEHLGFGKQLQASGVNVEKRIRLLEQWVDRKFRAVEHRLEQLEDTEHESRTLSSSSAQQVNRQQLLPYSAERDATFV